MRNYDVAIIGAGPAGLALAAALLGSGRRVGLFDRSPSAVLADPPFDGREIALTHRSQSFLRDYGVWERLPPDEIAPLREARVENGGFPLVLRFAPPAAEGPLGHFVPHHRLRRALFETVAAAPASDLIAGRRVVGIEPGFAACRLRLEDGTVYEAPLVVAADSRFSEARRHAGIGARVHDFGRTIIVGRLGHERPHRGVAVEWFDHGQTIALLPLVGAVSSVVLTLPPAEAAAVMALDDRAFGAEITRRYRGRLGAMRALSTRHAYPLVATYAYRFIAPRFALLGDAAVGMHPVTAHGFNFALLGAALLADAIRGGDDPGERERLVAYEAALRRATLPLFVATNAIARLYVDERPPARLARVALIGAGAILAPIRHAIVRHVMAAPVRARAASSPPMPASR